MPQKILCRVAEIIPHGERVYTVLLQPQARMPRFAAGQFLHLALDTFRPGDFWPDSRCFSIASSPSQTDTLRITYAVKGVFTTRMERELATGCDVWIKMPYGEFIVARDRDVCLLAGGTGMTAFTAFLTDLPAEHPHEVDVFYGARRTGLLIYRKLLEQWALGCTTSSSRACSHLWLCAEEPSLEEAVEQGRLDLDYIAGRLDQPSKLTYYVAGPPAMIKALTAGLPTLGVPSSQIVVDAWE